MLDLPDEFMSLLCTKPKDARLHVDFLSGLQPERLQQKISATGSWTHVVGFRPTGDADSRGLAAANACKDWLISEPVKTTVVTFMELTCRISRNPFVLSLI